MALFGKLAVSYRATLAALALSLLAATAAADEPIPLNTSLICRAERTFVICSMPVSVPPGMWITYAETRLITVPDFLQLAGASKFDQHKNAKPSLRLGFVVKRPGKGTLAVEARTVVCRNHPVCPHVYKVASTVIDIPNK